MFIFICIFITFIFPFEGPTKARVRAGSAQGGFRHEALVHLVIRDVRDTSREPAAAEVRLLWV